MKMSNYKKEKVESGMTWQEKWDVIFHNFIDRNSEKLSRTYYNGVVKAWERKGKAEKDKEIKISNEIIKSISEQELLDFIFYIFYIFQVLFCSSSNCKSSNCKESAIYGKNFLPTYCETHKNDDDINFVERECISCNLIMILDDNNKCEYCNPESFKFIRLIKQNALMDYSNANDLKGESTDKIVNGGSCGKERPDRVYDFGDKIVILECDEYQHKNRQCVCEQTRMVNLGQSYGGIPVYFIRWNPDDYKQPNTDKKPDTILQRHKLVKDFIKDIKNNKLKLPVALVSAFYMYYDDWERLNNDNWEIITALEHN